MVHGESTLVTADKRKKVREGPAENIHSVLRMNNLRFETKFMSYKEKNRRKTPAWMLWSVRTHEVFSGTSEEKV